MSSGHSSAQQRGVPGDPVVLLAPSACFGVRAGSPTVRSLQRSLVELGFSPGPVDGRYGPLTTAAVRRFQQARGLAPDAITASRQALASGCLAPGAGYLQPGGSRQVRALQRRLSPAGFSPGPVDGRYGPVTAQAIKLFQQAHRLTADGIAGIRTQAALGGAQEQARRT